MVGCEWRPAPEVRLPPLPGSSYTIMDSIVRGTFKAFHSPSNDIRVIASIMGICASRIFFYIFSLYEQPGPACPAAPRCR